VCCSVCSWCVVVCVHGVVQCMFIVCVHGVVQCVVCGVLVIHRICIGHCWVVLFVVHSVYKCIYVMYG